MIEQLIEAANVLCPGLDPFSAWVDKAKRLPLLLFGAGMVIAAVSSTRLTAQRAIESADEEVDDNGVQDND